MPTSQLTNPFEETGTTTPIGTGGGTAGGETTGGSEAAGASGSQGNASNVGVMLYDAATGSRKWLPARLVGPASWTIEPMGGYADFTVSTYEDAETRTFSPAHAGDRVDVFANGQRQFRGYVSDLTTSEDEPPTLTIGGYGRILDLDKMLLQGNYQYPDAVDVSQIFADVAADVQARYPDISVYADFVGVTTNNIEAQHKTAREVLSGLYEFVSAFATIGFDVDEATGRDRLYLRRKSTVADHVFSIPSRNIGKRENALHISDLVNVVSIEGDEPDYPQMLPNSSFEVMAKKGDGGGNLLVNASFEDGDVAQADYWTLSNGARRIDERVGVNVHTGIQQIVLDQVGEKFSQEQITPIVDIVPGHDYTFSFWAHPQIDTPLGNPSVVEGRLFWRVGGSYISPVTVFAAPFTEEYKQFEVVTRAPSGATGFKVEIEQTGGSTGSGRGIVLDDVQFYDNSLLVPAYWDVVRFGAANINTLNWRASGAFHGRNCLFLDADATDADNHDIHIQCVPQYRFNVTGGTQLRFSLMEKTLAGETAPKQFQEIKFFDKDGNAIGNNSKTTINPAAPYLDWTYIETVALVPQQAVQAEAWITVRGAGRFFLDALSVRQANDNETVFLDAGNLFVTFRADDLVTNVENSDVAQSIVRYGLREKVVKVSGIKSIADARSVAKTYLLDNASDVPAPVLDVYDYDAYLWVGNGVRLAGADAERYSDRLLPLMRINGSIDGTGLLTHQCELHKVKLTEQELYARLAKKTSNQITASAGASATSVPTGGTVTTGGGTTTAGVVALNGAAGAVLVDAGTGISVSTSGQTITAALANSGVTAGSYTRANITVDATGRITSAANGSGGASVAGVSSINNIQGAVNITPGNRISFDYDLAGDGFTIDAQPRTTIRTQGITGVAALTNADETIHLVADTSTTFSVDFTTTQIVTVLNAKTSGTITVSITGGAFAGGASLTLAAGQAARLVGVKPASGSWVAYKL